MNKSLTQLIYQGLLPMLGYWPQDDAALLQYSTPHASLDNARTLFTQRTFAAPVAVESCFNLAWALKTEVVKVEQVWELIANEFWRNIAEQTLTPFVSALESSTPFDQLLAAWADRVEEVWLEEGDHYPSSLKPISATTQSDYWLVLPPSPWQGALADFYVTAGHFAARIMQCKVSDYFAERTLIFESSGARIYRYGAVSARPIMLVFATVNRPNVLDLDESDTLIKLLQENGFTPYLVDWTATAHHVNRFDDYVDLISDHLLPAVLRDAQSQQIELLGVCQGGVMSLLAAERSPTDIARLHLLVTPLQFNPEQDRLCQWVQTNEWLTTPTSVQTEGLVTSPGALNIAFQMLKPHALRLGKIIQWIQHPPDTLALGKLLRMEHWLISGPNLSVGALQSYRRFTQDTPSLTPVIHAVSRRIPVQLFVAKQDHIVPLASAMPERDESSAIHDPVHAIVIHTLDTGHIGLLMGKARFTVARYL